MVVWLGLDIHRKVCSAAVAGMVSEYRSNVKCRSMAWYALTSHHYQDSKRNFATSLIQHLAPKNDDVMQRTRNHRSPTPRVSVR